MSIECTSLPQAGPSGSRPPTAGAVTGQQARGFAAVLQGMGDATPAATATTQALTSNPATSAASATATAVEATTGAAPTAATAAAEAAAAATVTANATSAEPVGHEPVPNQDQAITFDARALSVVAVAPAAKKTADVHAPGVVPGAGPEGVAQALLAQFLGLAGSQGTQATGTVAGSAAIIEGATGSNGIARADLAKTPQTSTTQPLPEGTAPPSNFPMALANATPARPWEGGHLAQAGGAEASSPAGDTAGATRWFASARTQGQIPWQSTVATQIAAPLATRSAAQESQLRQMGGRDASNEAATQPASILGNSATTPGPLAALTSSESTAGGSARRRFGAEGGPEVTRMDAPASAAMGGAVLDSTQTGVVAGTATSSGQTLERAVAEQVKYWISNDVHNAQLKLDGLGPESVQVSISMSGNQAQVVFRSDLAQTRELLGNAMAQLDQMLNAQGLTLSGAWVGSSGQQGQFGAQSQSSQAAPQRTTTAPQGQAVELSAPARRSVPSDRAVDLFV